MAFAMSGRPRPVDLQERLLYGSIATIRVTHLFLQPAEAKAWVSRPVLAGIAALAHRDWMVVHATQAGWCPSTFMVACSAH